MEIKQEFALIQIRAEAILQNLMKFKPVKMNAFPNGIALIGLLLNVLKQKNKQEHALTQTNVLLPPENRVKQERALLNQARVGFLFPLFLAWSR